MELQDLTNDELVERLRATPKSDQQPIIVEMARRVAIEFRKNYVQVKGKPHLCRPRRARRAA